MARVEKTGRVVRAMNTRILQTIWWRVARLLGIAPRNGLDQTLQDILRTDIHILQGLQTGDDDLSSLLHELADHRGNLRLSAFRCNQFLAANLRQTLLMAIVPANAFDSGFTGSIDRAISEHLVELGVTLSVENRQQLRDICINIRKVRHLTGKQARRVSKSLSDLRANPSDYTRIMTAQNDRCIWCGVVLVSSAVKMSLEHMAPKHVGDDPADGKNLAIACTTCNSGKGELLSWASSPFASGFLRAMHFRDPNMICIENRWIVLALDRRCESCRKGPLDVELGVCREIQSGLPIPQHCTTTCANCATTLRKDVPVVALHADEFTRTF